MKNVNPSDIVKIIHNYSDFINCICRKYFIIGGTKEALKQMAGQFELPPKQYTTCPRCGKTAQKFPNGRVGCSNCGYGLFGSRAEQKIVCPKCGSTTCDQINGIRYCYDCDHEW